MSKHHNYTKYSGQTTSPVVEEVVETAVQEEVVETAVQEEVVETPQTSITKVEEVIKTLEGVVDGCSKLNVREQPRPDAEVVCQIDRFSKVEIYVEESTTDFYKVCTENGVDGFCMKKFIVTK